MYLSEMCILCFVIKTRIVVHRFMGISCFARLRHRWNFLNMNNQKFVIK